jgi:hypothetical protein
MADWRDSGADRTFPRKPASPADTRADAKKLRTNWGSGAASLTEDITD